MPSIKKREKVHTEISHKLKVMNAKDNFVQADTGL